MNPDKLFTKLHPLLNGFGINPSELSPAWSYELQAGDNTLFLTLDASGCVMLAVQVAQVSQKMQAKLGWLMLNENSFNQPAPALIHSASHDGKIILWCTLSLHCLSAETLLALPERFLARMLQTQALLNDPASQNAVGPPAMASTRSAIVEKSVDNPLNRESLLARQLQEKLAKTARPHS